MSDFFTKRLHDYEEHMSIWKKSYRIIAEHLPLGMILDLGCGTGIDLCAGMPDKLLEKHHDKPLTTVCQDYFQYDFGYGKWDAVISFESLHHFLPERKTELYRKICCSLKESGLLISGDYIACCNEEEELLRSVYLKKRKQSAIPENCYVHFDIPLTLDHEKKILQNAGFGIEKILDDNATIIIAGKASF